MCVLWNKWINKWVCVRGCTLCLVQENKRVNPGLNPRGLRCLHAGCAAGFVCCSCYSCCCCCCSRLKGERAEWCWTPAPSHGHSKLLFDCLEHKLQWQCDWLSPRHAFMLNHCVCDRWKREMSLLHQFWWSVEHLSWDHQLAAAEFTVVAICNSVYVKLPLT